MWTFEQLEERHFLSATTLANLDDLQWTTVSSSTAEGQQLIDLLNQQWRTRSSDTGEGTATTQYAANSLPNDPYLSYQWNLLNVGQLTGYHTLHDVYGAPGEDINVVPAWDSGVTGEGVLVAVVDTGVDVTHPDLADNISIYRYNAITGGTNVDPSLIDPVGYHGTAVAGIIAGVGDNGEGITGIAYNAEIMPILMLGDGLSGFATSQDIAAALLGNGAPVDISNNSWGPNTSRYIDASDLFYDPQDPTDADFVELLITAATTGRDGKGTIYVFASGNSAGPQFSQGFDDIGIWDSAGSNFYINSPYTIGVGMVDHDGSIFNSDGTLTLYGEMSSSVLVVAPSASGPFDTVSTPDTGSGIWSTDLQGDNGSNQSPLGGEIEIDGDNFPYTDYTSRFGGTSAAAPEVSGVIALMLEANPDLSYRDVEEILIRSSRQNSPLGMDTNGLLVSPETPGGHLDASWIVNAIPQFRDPIQAMGEDIPNSEFRWQVIVDPESSDPEDPDYIVVPIDDDAGYNPIADPTIVVGEGEDAVRVSTAVPYQYTTGAGYTVSYGRYGQFATEYGYAHGVVDAELAVELAQKWDTYDQYLAPELTYLAYLSPPGSYGIPAAEVSSEETGLFRVPGGIGGVGGFIDYFEEFFKVPDLLDAEEGAVPEIDPSTMPFMGDDPPVNTRGSGIPIAGPSGENAMNVEWVEVQLDLSGGGNDQDFLRLTLVSPDGTESELTNYQVTKDDPRESYQVLPDTVREGQIFRDPPDQLSETDTFSWIYSTNRDWGERSEGSWTLSGENYSGTAMSLDGVRVLFHGTAVSAAGEDVFRVSGKVGLDAGYGDGSLGYVAHDGIFEFSQYYPNLEPYAAGTTVIATDAATGQVVDRFVVGADGNYYFDLPEGDYELVVLDPDARTIDGDAQEAYSGFGASADYGSSWMVSVGPESYDPDFPSLYSVRSDFVDGVNFLLDPGDLPDNEVNFEGVVYADLDGDGIKDAEDAGVAGFLVYADLNHTGQREASEPYDLTDAYGAYSLTVDTTIGSTYTIGVQPLDGWDVTYPGEPSPGFHTEFAEVGETLTELDFGVTAASTLPNLTTGMVFGFVFGDENGDGVRQATETGVPSIPVILTQTQTAASTDGPQTVEDSTIYSEIQIGNIGDIADINVNLDISHATDSELEVYLISPAGTRIELFAGVGGSSNNFTNTTLDDEAATSISDGAAPFTGSYQPMGLLSEFDGEDPSGTWQLEITDVGAGDAGTLNSWSLTVRGTVLTVQTNDNGAFQFANVEPGDWQVEPVIDLPSSITQPSTGYREVTVTAGEVVSGLVYGVANMAIYDYGDLVGDGYRTTLAEDGPRHRAIPGFSLGAEVDAELDTATIEHFDSQGNPDPPTASLDGVGDDVTNLDDEDGVSIVGGALKPGVNTFEVELNGVGGYLDAWIDLNNDGDFDDVVGGISEHVITSLHRNTGTHQLQIVLPALLDGGEDEQVASRFRWSRTFGLDYYGAADIGEVEDYLFDVTVPLFGDYDGSGYVDDSDYDVWKSTYGSTTDFRADGNYDGVVDTADYSVWRDHLGDGTPPSGTGALVLDSSGDEAAASSTSTRPLLTSLGTSTNWTPSDEYLAWIEGLGGTVAIVDGQYHFVFSADSATATTTSSAPTAVGDSGLLTGSDMEQLGVFGLQFPVPVDAQPMVAVDVSPAAADATTSAELQLLDYALSDIAPHGDDGERGDEPLLFAIDDGGAQDTAATDLALAAALEEETPWWVGV